MKTKKKIVKPTKGKKVKIVEPKKVIIPEKEYIGGKEVISTNTILVNGNKKTEKTLIDGSTTIL